MTEDDPEAELDELEERAAIIQEGERCGAMVAELTAAQLRGYKSWSNALLVLNKRIREKKA